MDEIEKVLGQGVFPVKEKIDCFNIFSAKIQIKDLDRNLIEKGLYS